MMRPKRPWRNACMWKENQSLSNILSARIELTLRTPQARVLSIERREVRATILESALKVKEEELQRRNSTLFSHLKHDTLVK